jgi:hypothetical protein
MPLFSCLFKNYNPPPPLSLLCFDLFLVEHNLSFLVLQGLLIYMTTDWKVVESFLLCIISSYIRFLFDASPTLPMHNTKIFWYRARMLDFFPPGVSMLLFLHFFFLFILRVVHCVHMVITVHFFFVPVCF